MKNFTEKLNENIRNYSFNNITEFNVITELEKVHEFMTPKTNAYYINKILKLNKYIKNKI